MPILISHLSPEEQDRTIVDNLAVIYGGEYLKMARFKAPLMLYHLSGELSYWGDSFLDREFTEPFTEEDVHECKEKILQLSQTPHARKMAETFLTLSPPVVAGVFVRLAIELVRQSLAGKENEFITKHRPNLGGD